MFCCRLVLQEGGRRMLGGCKPQPEQAALPSCSPDRLAGTTAASLPPEEIKGSRLRKAALRGAGRESQRYLGWAPWPGQGHVLWDLAVSVASNAPPLPGPC